MRFLLILLCMCGTVRAENFVGADARYLETAERARRDIAIFWNGEPYADWSAPCTMQVRVTPDTDQKTSTGGGSTVFNIHQGEVFNWNMSIEGPEDKLHADVIPHEVAHTITATMTRRAMPRWLDEGVAHLFESEASRHRMRDMAEKYIDQPIGAWWMFDSTGEYPKDPQQCAAMYSTGLLTVEWLFEMGGRDRLKEFITTKDPPSVALQKIYGLTVNDGYAQWRTWARERVAAQHVTNYGDAEAWAVTPTEAVAANRPILYAVGSDSCVACLPFVNSMRWMPAFRNAVNARAVVVRVDGMVYAEWCRKRRITRWPAFVLQWNGRESILWGYPGRTDFITWLNTSMASMAVATTTAPATPTLAESATRTTGPSGVPQVNPPPTTPPQQTMPVVPEIITQTETTAAPVPPGYESPEERPASTPGGLGGMSQHDILLWVLGAGLSLTGFGWARSAITAARGAKTIIERVHHARTAQPEAQKAPPQAVPITPTVDAVREHHYVVDAVPDSIRHRVDTQVVRVESDTHQRAYEKAFQEVVRRYPAAEPYLKIQKDLIDQFKAGGI